MAHKDSKNIYRVFSNEERVKLIVCLSKSKNVTDMLSLCHLSQSALSQHLKILRDEGIVSCVRDGKKQIYSIENTKALTLAKELVQLSQ